MKNGNSDKKAKLQAVCRYIKKVLKYSDRKLTDNCLKLHLYRTDCSDIFTCIFTCILPGI